MVYYSSNLTLFSSEIDPRRNLFIDDVEQYLSSLTGTVSLEDFKRFTPAETVSVRVAVTDAQMAVGAYLSSRWNYARVLYEDDSYKNSFFWYYFVASIEMVADGTLAISLQLDALNTFRNWKGALTDRTFVTRQLVNRWDSDGRPSSVFTPEDISGEIVKASETELTPSRGYLIFETTSGSPTLKCTSADGIMFINHAIIERDWLFASAKTSNPTGIRLTGTGAKKLTVTYGGTIHSKTVSGNQQIGFAIVRGTTSSGNQQARIFFEVDGEIEWQTAITGSSSTIFWDSIEVEAQGTFTAVKCDYSFTWSTSKTIDGITVGARAALQTDPIATIDRTSENIFKIVETPFLPEVGSYGAFHLSSAEAYLLFDDLESMLTYAESVDLSEIVRSKPDSYDSASSAMLDDPKIWSSAFSYYKVVYDSYSTTVSLDSVNPSADSFSVKWTGSGAMSSASIVQLIQKKGNVTVEPRNVKEDYPFLISSDRNNELPLYSIEWLNYLRTGYNYDKKSNAMSIATSVLSTVGSLVMGIATVATGGTSAAATIPAAVGMAGAAVSGWTSTASTINSQLAKETQMKNQSFSVSSVNDLSLFKAYGNATVKIEWWAPREDYKRRLGQLFFYRGYAVNEQYAPSLDIRTSFDYVECVPSWSGSFIQRTPPQFISLLNDRLAQGVTIIHHYEDSWDIAQEKGNLEK